MSAKSPAIIIPDATYGFDALRQVTGWGDFARKSAQRNGLVVRYCGGRGFVHGRDLITYINERGETTHQAAKQGQ